MVSCFVMAKKITDTVVPIGQLFCEISRNGKVVVRIGGVSNTADESRRSATKFVAEIRRLLGGRPAHVILQPHEGGVRINSFGDAFFPTFVSGFSPREYVTVMCYKKFRQMMRGC